MSSIKQYIHHRWIIVWGIFLVNLLFFFGVRYFATPQDDTSEQRRVRNEYATILASTGSSIVWNAPAYLKLWDVEWARTFFLSETYETVPSRWLVIRKSILLQSKNDTVWAQQVLEDATHTDPLIRSLFLALRAYIYCVDKKRDACEILAEDSVTLDPLAPFWLILQWITHHARREFTEAKNFFARAEKLWGYCLDIMCLYARGITDFYNADYTWAIKDLSSIVEDELYGYDAKIFLWRTFYNKKIFSEAQQRFTLSRDSVGGVDRTSELRLARVALAQWDTKKALSLYENAYLSTDYGVELVTDYLLLAHFTHDTDLVDQLTQQVESMMGGSRRNYLLAVRSFKDINNVALAKSYLQKWRLVLAAGEDSEEKEKYEDDFSREEHNILVKEIYQTLVSGQDIQQQLITLDALAIDPLHNAFLRWLQSLVTNGMDTTLSWFQLIPQISDGDIMAIRFWYVLFRGDTKRALQILTETNNGYNKNDIKMLWMKWAVTSRLGEEQLAARYLYQIKESWAAEMFSPTPSQQELRKEAFRAFSPRMHWMEPYFPLDFWWVNTTSSTWTVTDF